MPAQAASALAYEALVYCSVDAALWADAGRRPDACAAANDHLGCGALLGAQALGLRVPQDLALTGFGDFELAAHLTPGLTTLAPPRQEIGERTAELVLTADDEAPARIRVTCPLVIRGSS